MVTAGFIVNLPFHLKKARFFVRKLDLCHLPVLIGRAVEAALDQILTEVSTAVPDWSGGTRIGDAIKKFNFDWGRRVLRRGAIFLLISDGWDRGDPALLGKEMARLQRHCYRLIWLNPQPPRKVSCSSTMAKL